MPLAGLQLSTAFSSAACGSGLSLSATTTRHSGIVEPVRGGVDAGLRLGVGKAEQESFFVSAENVVRKRLETEVQADEDYERTLKREVRGSRERHSLFQQWHAGALALWHGQQSALVQQWCAYSILAALQLLHAVT